VAFQKAWGVPPEGVADIFGKNTYRVASEVAFGTGTPLGAKYGSRLSALPYDEQAEVTRQVVNEVVPQLAHETGVRITSEIYGPGGWRAWVNPSAQVDVLGPPERIDDFMALLGHTFQQDMVIASRPRVPTKSESGAGAVQVVFDVAATDPTTVRQTVERFWQRLRTIAPQWFEGNDPGFSPHFVGDRIGMRLFDPMETVRKRSKAKFPAFDDPSGGQAVLDAVRQAAQAEKLPLIEDELGMLWLDARVQTNDWTQARPRVTLRDTLPPLAPPTRGTPPKTKTVTRAGAKVSVPWKELTPAERGRVTRQLNQTYRERMREWDEKKALYAARRSAVESIYERGWGRGSHEATSYESGLGRRGRSDLLGRLDRLPGAPALGAPGQPGAGGSLSALVEDAIERALRAAEARVGGTPGSTTLGAVAGARP
jgi:hypothetical protein